MEEEEMIIQLHSILGNKWSAIAARLPGRTDNEIKNYWNTRIRKRLLHMGIDPVTHSPRLDLLDLSSILNNTPLYSSPQMSHLSSFLGPQTLVNPEILRLASSIVSPHVENPNCLPQNFQQNQYHQLLIQDQLHAPPIQEFPTCVPSSNNEASQVMERNVDEYRDPLAAYNNGYYYVPEKNYETPNPLQGNSFAPVLSAATNSSSSTPGNSNSPCITGGGSIEDERESYCSNLLNYEIIPDLLDMNSCNEIRQLIGDSEYLGPWNIQSC
ncbi:hypothetical protein CDL15_Pgr016957 [Punica granatum]|nr:hypothetical protein CDL15_Pgr016957 [Punica granatum]